MSLRRNVIANYLGQGWAAAMGLAFVPLYIRYLGMEAYGLIGLFALMQAWLGLLDMGMTPTLGREMARFTAGARSAQSIRNLLRSLEIVCFSVAIAIGIVVWAASGWLASDWLKADRLSAGVVQSAIAVMALVIALRFVEALYRGALFGLQRQVWFNAVNAAIATLRGVGAIVVLAGISTTIEAFFLWQAFVSLISVIVIAAGVHSSLPRTDIPARLSLKALHEIRGFAGGMLGIALLSLLLTQVDKVLLSRLLTLEAFGKYTLAATVAGTLYLVVTPITAALYPRLVELASDNDGGELASVYQRGAQLVTALTAPAALLLALFGDGVLFAWTGNAGLAHSAGPLLSALACGTFLNGLMYMPYQLQLAHGWTSLALKVNAVAVAVLVPAIFWIVPAYGAIGAAWVWIALNAVYVIVSIDLMHRRLLPAEKSRWYLSGIASPLAATGVTLLLLRVFQPNVLHDRIGWSAFLVGAGLAALVAAAFTVKDFRMRIFPSMRRIRNA